MATFKTIKDLMLAIKDAALDEASKVVNSTYNDKRITSHYPHKGEGAEASEVSPAELPQFFVVDKQKHLISFDSKSPSHNREFKRLKIYYPISDVFIIKESIKSEEFKKNIINNINSKVK